ncbi:MAG: transporter ATP-binding protein [Acidimicrobiales bacterium]|nr:transporter ATP-binding protein [Acidimicrobiales bacterium]
MSSLTMSGVSVSYGRREVVHDFTCTVGPGEWVCLIGPNGAGKSSILRAIAGLAKHTGEIGVEGSPLRLRTSRRQAQLIAYVRQSPTLPSDMSAFDYVLLGRNPYVSYFGAETANDRDLVGRVLERLDMATFADRLLGTLSGGEQQRLVIARALAQEAPILLLDEPTSALDIGHQQQALELVDSLRREHGLTVVSAMHDLTLAGLYADRLALLHEGHLVVAGTAAQVLRAETLAEFYGVSVTVHNQDDGTVVVVPRRTASS